MLIYGILNECITSLRGRDMSVDTRFLVTIFVALYMNSSLKLSLKMQNQRNYSKIHQDQTQYPNQEERSILARKF